MHAKRGSPLRECRTLVKRLLQCESGHSSRPATTWQNCSSCNSSRKRTPCLLVNRASTLSSSDGDALMHPRPSFDEPPRLASREEALAVAVGAHLTPEQQTAKRLQLPITLRIRMPPGIPPERQVMAQIQAAATWQELESVLYRLAPPAVAGTAAAVGRSTSSSSGVPQARTVAEQQGQGQQPLLISAQRQPRRRQPVRPLSVEPLLQTTQQREHQQAQQPGTFTTAAGYDQLTTVIKPAPALNQLHTTEAIRRLAQLLPQNPSTLNPKDRARAAALIDFLTQQALALAQTLEVDPRGVAIIAAGMAKLGQKDAALVAALQEAALLQVNGFNAQELAVLLGGLVKLRVRPDPALISAVQQHILTNLHLFKHQSMANTIWALAKLSSTTAEQQPTITTSSSSSSSSEGGGNKVESGGVSAKFVSSLVQRCYPQMCFWSCQHLAQAAWGLARLSAKPNDKWCRALLLATSKQLSKMSPQDLANTIAALPALGAMPEPAWLDAFCTTAAAKMRHTQPLGLCSILFGLAKVKRARRKADRTAAKQQLRSQPETGLEVPGTSTSAQEASESRATATSEGNLAPGSAAARPAELKLLRAALMWLQRQQHQLTAQQLAGVIMSLAELLPDCLLNQDPAQQPIQQQHVQDDDMQLKRQHVVSMLRTLLAGWQPLMEQRHLAAGLPKKQAKLLVLAWGRLQQKATTAT